MLAIVEKNNGLFHGDGNFAIFSFFFFVPSDTLHSKRWKKFVISLLLFVKLEKKRREND